jgi:hypothetical protein
VTDDIGVVRGGNRRIDRLLGQDHDVGGLPMAELRRYRDGEADPSALLPTEQPPR